MGDDGRLGDLQAEGGLNMSDLHVFQGVYSHGLKRRLLTTLRPRLDQGSLAIAGFWAAHYRGTRLFSGSRMFVGPQNKVSKVSGAGGQSSLRPWPGLGSGHGLELPFWTGL